MEQNKDDIENQYFTNDISENINNNKTIELINFIKLSNNKLHKVNKIIKSKSYSDIFINKDKNIDTFEEYNPILYEDKNKKNSILNYNLRINKNIIYNNKFKKIINYCKFNYFCSFKTKLSIDTLNKFMTIILHIFIMIVFEIYFYFNYIILIEKESFLKQIDKYIYELKQMPLNSLEQKIIKYELDTNQNVYKNYLDNLYKAYINSLKYQKALLYKLLKIACIMAGSTGIILIILFSFGLYNRKKIKWNWIWIENLLMFLLLGIFEYLFFTNIIMNYNPITDQEIKYHVVNKIINHYNSTM
jgi:hypothetical protein